ncbi:MAG: polysaccharide biosynthesis/export family protein [Imperialibacter sp.]|uniref:polysaccharide biosynthesis/export family protein n=1 Tax=Imperialibacter sp. TaxID=2038411 RepID=UPI0032ED3BD2
MKRAVKRRNIIIALTLSFFLEGCLSHRNVLYLQKLDSSNTTSADQHSTHDFNIYTLQKGDVVSIEVRSIDPKVTEIFKNVGGSNNTTQIDFAANANFLTGYKVSQNGKIELPLIGFIAAEGLTIDSLKNSIERQLKRYINDPFIVVRTGGIRYTAIGEVVQPGRYTVLQDRLTIFEALANAGELTGFANRKKIVLIRQSSDGKDIYHIDLTDISLIDSPFFYIKQGDLIYAEPHKLSQVSPAVLIGRDVALIVVAVSAVIWLFTNAGN